MSSSLVLHQATDVPEALHASHPTPSSPSLSPPGISFANLEPSLSLTSPSRRIEFHPRIVEKELGATHIWFLANLEPSMFVTSPSRRIQVCGAIVENELGAPRIWCIFCQPRALDYFYALQQQPFDSIQPLSRTSEWYFTYDFFATLQCPMAPMSPGRCISFHRALWDTELGATPMGSLCLLPTPPWMSAHKGKPCTDVEVT
ncbi:hypothetical protein C8F01DRAFT_1248002 [Mycena amicta]|nr:hypothetical protein C8F01DRAFT_1248002 [Mycena amicta]